jgi:isopenicillin-N epimerase
VNSDLARYWALDPEITYLNHGSFGACPLPVLAAQSELRARLEREPVRFLANELDGRLATARGRLAEFMGAQPDDLAFLPNATTGINTVLRSLEFQPGDEVLSTDHEYNACLNAIRFVAGRSGARLVEARVPFPVDDPGAVVDAIMGCATERTRLAVISHVTSATALIFPIERVVAALAERGIDTLVDGAHAPGMLPLDIDRLGAAYYAGNAHKWLCAPKGAGFLHVRADRQAGIRPLVISHGANAPRHGASLFRLEFDWLGTADPTPYLALPAALDFMATLLPGGWREVMRTNHELALGGWELVRRAIGGEPVAPPEMIGSMAALVVPVDLEPRRPAPDADAELDSTLSPDPLGERLLEDFAIEVPVYAWPPTRATDRPSVRLLRVSAQLYNSRGDYGRLADALTAARSPAG